MVPGKEGYVSDAVLGLASTPVFSGTTIRPSTSESRKPAHRVLHRGGGTKKRQYVPKGSQSWIKKLTEDGERSRGEPVSSGVANVVDQSGCGLIKSPANEGARATRIDDGLGSDSKSRGRNECSHVTEAEKIPIDDASFMETATTKVLLTPPLGSPDVTSQTLIEKQEATLREKLGSWTSQALLDQLCKMAPPFQDTSSQSSVPDLNTICDHVEKLKWLLAGGSMSKMCSTSSSSQCSPRTLNASSPIEESAVGSAHASFCETDQSFLFDDSGVQLPLPADMSASWMSESSNQDGLLFSPSVSFHESAENLFEHHCNWMEKAAPCLMLASDSFQSPGPDPAMPVDGKFDTNSLSDHVYFKNACELDRPSLESDGYHTDSEEPLQVSRVQS